MYDITDFVVEHPGGDQILLAAGSSVEPFWMLYAVHNNPHVWKILETLRIGKTMGRVYLNPALYFSKLSKNMFL